MGAWNLPLRQVEVASHRPPLEGSPPPVSNRYAGAALRGYLASADAFLYETAKVENISAKPISAVTFGVLVADPSNRQTPNFLRSSLADVTLLPGKTQDVSVRLLPASLLEDLKRSLSRNPKSR